MQQSQLHDERGKFRAGVKRPPHWRRGGKPPVPYRFISPDGKVVEGIGINGFCRENDLNRVDIYRLMIGDRKSVKGWRMAWPCEMCRVVGGHHENCPYNGD